jgi:hypothetical protein
MKITDHQVVTLWGSALDKHRKAKDVTTATEIDVPLERAKPHDSDPLARTVHYVPLLKILIIGLSNGRRISLPIEDVPELSKATKKVLQNCELLDRGTAINFPYIDVALSIDGIIEGVYGKSRWMAELGQKGGSAKDGGGVGGLASDGKKGGRPKKVMASS